jgi:hypothetical protein
LIPMGAYVLKVARSDQRRMTPALASDVR